MTSFIKSFIILCFVTVNAAVLAFICGILVGIGIMAEKQDEKDETAESETPVKA